MAKQLIFLLIFFNSLSICIFAQKKKDNTFVIPQYINMHEIKTVLFQNGYTFENSSDTSFLNTSSKKLPNSFISIKMSFAITDTALYIKGMVKSDKNDPLTVALIGKSDAEPDFMQVEYFKIFKKQIDWDEINRIAKILSPEVYYIRQ